MSNRIFAHSHHLVLWLIVLCGMGGCKEDRRFDWPYSLSPNGDKLAVCVGTAYRENSLGPGADPLCKRVVILDPVSKHPGAILIPGSQGALLASWRPNTRPPQLFLVTQTTPHMGSRLSSVEVASNALDELASTSVSTSYDIVDMRWNPSGQIAALCVYDEIEGRRFLGLTDGTLGSITRTALQLDRHELVWLDAGTLCLVSGGRIVSVDVDEDLGKNRVLTPIILKEGAGDLQLFGQIEGEIVFRRDDSVYKGERLLYRDESGYIGKGLTAGRYVMFLASGWRIVVLDEEGLIVCDMKRSCEIIGLDEKRSWLYLLDERNLCVIRVNIATLEEETLRYASTIAE